MESLTSITWTGAAVLVAAYLVWWRLSPLYSIPTVGGPSAPLISYWSAWNAQHKTVRLFNEGYRKFRGSAFKFPLMDRWLVVVNGPEMVEDLRQRPEDELSFTDAVQELSDMRSLFGKHAEDHSPGLFAREKLTRILPAIFSDVVDELSLAIPAYISADNEDWVSVNMMETFPRVIARISTRVFVGLPLCHNEDYLDIAINYTVVMGEDKTYTRMVPAFMKRLIGDSRNSKMTQYIQRAVAHLRPLIEECRRQKEERDVNFDDKPRDLIRWRIEHEDCSDESITYNVLMLNFAAIHTTSLTLTQVLYDIATAPGVIAELREEIEPMIAAEGWTKATMDKMRKLDSTLKESQRMNGLGVASLMRKAMKDVTLRDGTFLPRGTTVMAALHPMNQDETKYVSPREFDPFRFARLRQQEGENMKHQLVHTSPEYVSFGHGKHACPGRFFAANELKAMLAYLLVNYDIKLAGDGSRPENINTRLIILPNPNGRILFRKRQTLQSS